jgi:hypothetical protein
MPYVIPATRVSRFSIGLKRRKRALRPKITITRNPKRVGNRRVQARYIPVTNSNILKNVTKKNNEWPWPGEIKGAFAISIRPERYQALKQRLGPWQKYVRLFGGTNGHHINRRQWAKKVRGNFKRGEIGCYDSHVRLWQKVATMNGPVLILEDDAALFYNQQTSQRFRHLFDEITKKNPKWDLIYLGHYGDMLAGAPVAPGLHAAKVWQGLFAYIIKPEAARKLVQGAWPMRSPSDVYVGSFISRGVLHALRAEPRFCFVVTRNSDTAGIV